MITHEWNIKSDPWDDDHPEKTRAHYGDDDLLIVVSERDGKEVMWISVVELLDTIGSRYALAHILTRITEGVESKPALVDFHGLAGEISAHGALIEEGIRAGIERANKRKRKVTK